MTEWPVVLDELDPDGVVRSLTADQATTLHGTQLVSVRPEGLDRWRIMPAGRVGATRVGDKQVQVRPKGKVGIANLIFMLGYANDPGFTPEDVLGIADEDLWPALAESLARQGERALAHGVLQGYHTVDDSLRTVRGRIRVNDQLKERPGWLLPLEVSYDEFTVDTAENRILRTGLRRMLGVPRLRGDVRRRLLHLDTKLEGVHVLRPGERTPRWVPSRLNQRYQPALRLAEIVLRNVSATPGPDGLVVAAFVVSMAKVFEDFVTTALMESLAKFPGRATSQFPTELDEPAAGDRRGAIRMAVDLVHRDREGRPVVVYDAKYKAASSSGEYPNADHYQMLAYCTALQVPVAWLVYAQGSGEVRARRIRNTEVTVMEYPLDLGAAPASVLQQIDSLARVSAHHDVRHLSA